MRIILFSGLVLFSGCVSQDSPTLLFPTCYGGCSTPFGTTLGEAQGVKAYSNCSAKCIAFNENFIDLPTQEKKPSGLKWQCVEFARRYIIGQYGVTFKSVNHAHDIFDLAYFEDVVSGEPVPTEAFPQCSPQPPQTGDLIVYAKNPSHPALRYGHVAVVVNVELKDKDSKAYIAEQNYGNVVWESPMSHSRFVPLEKKNGLYCLLPQPFETIRGSIRILKKN